MSRDAVGERAVGHLDRDRVPLAQVVDVREGRQVGRAMTGDVDESVLAGYEASEVAAGPLLERVVVGAVDEDHVEAEARDPDPADRVALPNVLSVQPRLTCDRLPRGGQGGAERGRWLEGGSSLVVLGGQLV